MRGREVTGGPDCAVYCRSIVGTLAFTTTKVGNHWQLQSEEGQDLSLLSVKGLKWVEAQKKGSQLGHYYDNTGENDSTLS